jgi:flagellar basal body-associated protein FliL
MKRNDKLEIVLIVLLMVAIMAIVEWVSLKGYELQKSDRPPPMHMR